MTLIATSTEPPAILRDTFRTACEELLAAYGLSVVDQERIADEELPSQEHPAESEEVPMSSAAVDFGSPELRGTIALYLGRAVVLETTKTAGVPANVPRVLEDWTCELVNQLVGRMKNKLRGYQVSFHVNVPRLLPPDREVDSGANTVRYRFSCQCGPIAADLDVLVSASLKFKEPQKDEELLNEGELLLF